MQPNRLPNEAFEDYKFRRQFANFAIKKHEAGRLFYDSTQVKDNLGVNIPYQNLEKQKKRAEAYHYTPIRKG